MSFCCHNSIPYRPVLSVIPIRSMYNDLGKTNKEKIQTHWPDLITFFFLHSFPLCSAILFSLCPLTQKDVYLLLSTIHLAIFSEFWSWASPVRGNWIKNLQDWTDQDRSLLSNNLMQFPNMTQSYNHNIYIKDQHCPFSRHRSLYSVFTIQKSLLILFFLLVSINIQYCHSKIRYWSIQVK